MKPKPIPLVLVDLTPNLSPEIVARLQKSVCKTRYERPRKGRMLLRWIWQQPMIRYLQRIFPEAWFYRGGNHLAVHASPPPPTLTQPARLSGEAGQCLFRIVVKGK